MRLLLLSNSTNPGGGYLAHAAPRIRRFLGPDARRVAFVPYAAVTVSYDAYAARVAEALGALGHEIVPVHRAADPAAVVRAADAVAVGGGNTFRLLARLYETGLLEVIRDRVGAGAPYLGWSAGSNVACPTIRTTNDMPIVEPPSFRALGLVPFQINPHYTDARLPNHQGETRDERLAEFVALNPEMTVIGLPEGAMLLVEGGRVELLSGRPARIFRAGRPPLEQPPGPIELHPAVAGWASGGAWLGEAPVTSGEGT
ncbi:MAG TPA: dipeptidase PepE [Gemmatimonadales bacterium]|nr:dipeptidase PepE [Gemmatimonadales bacterium]